MDEFLILYIRLFKNCTLTILNKFKKHKKMITANEAADLMANSESAIKKVLQNLDGCVRVACQEGKNKIEVAIPADQFVEPISQRLRKLGYKVAQMHSKGIEISW